MHLLLWLSCTANKDLEPPLELSLDPVCNPLALGEDCLLPFPSTYQTQPADSETGVRLSYETSMLRSPGELNFDLSMLNIADGTSRLSPALINFGRDVSEEFLSGWGEQEQTVQAGAAIAMINVDTLERVPLHTEMNQANREWSDYDSLHPLIIRPMAPLDFSGRYAVVLTNELTDTAGNPLPRSAAFDALRDEIITTDERVELLRDDYNELFEKLEEAGWNRDSLLLSWEFQVASENFVLGPARSVRDQVLATDPETIDFTITNIETDPNEHLAYLVKGTFSPPSFIDQDSTLVLDQDNLPIEQAERPAYKFTMAVPAVIKEQGNLGVILIGHGLFGNGRGMIDSDGSEQVLHPMANELQSVLVATDWVGLSSGDRDLIIAEVLENINRVRVVTDRLLQSHANNLALVELTLGPLLEGFVEVSHDEQLINPEVVHYYGISLGGIQGASQTALSPRISRSVLAVPGAGWVNLIQRSTQFQPLEVYFDNFYPDPLVQLVLLGMSQTFFDWSDPGNLTYLLTEATGPKDIVLQEAIGDCQVANMTTDLLARSMNASHLENATDPIWGLETVPSPAQGVVISQVRVPEDLEYFPLDENRTPETDNGVHNSAVLRETMFNQIIQLFSTGEIVHPCDGLCDPD